MADNVYLRVVQPIKLQHWYYYTSRSLLQIDRNKVNVFDSLRKNLLTISIHSKLTSDKNVDEIFPRVKDSTTRSSQLTKRYEHVCQSWRGESTFPAWENMKYIIYQHCTDYYANICLRKLKIYSIHSGLPVK